MMGGPDFSQLPQWIPLIYLSSSILFAIVAMVDCGNTGQDPVVWGLIVLFFNLPGLLVYFFIARANFAPTRKHKAISRTQDVEIRARYASRGDPDELATLGTMAPNPGGIPESKGDFGFVDENLEKLINEGKFSEAKTYHDDLVAVANEMNDRDTIRNLKRYEIRISKGLMR
ncbi:PLDc_N domain-containing protein [bacterium]|nr:PLDc_N domain-containing protein [bacterium]